MQTHNMVNGVHLCGGGEREQWDQVFILALKVPPFHKVK